MTAVLFPIAPNPEAALNAPVGRAGLQSAAQATAQGPVDFARELAGPAFETREAAVAAYAARLDEPGRVLAPEDRYCELQAVMAPGGRRPRTVWRICVSYWKQRGDEGMGPVPQPRAVRRKAAGAKVEAGALGAMAEQPLRPLQPQKALDIGLFEVRLPENPGLIIPDE